jgi:hypothetical protein
MEIQVKPFVPKPGVKCMVLRITDIQLHTSPKRPTLSLGQKILNAFKTGLPGRFYGKMEKPTPVDTDHENNRFSVSMALQKDKKLLEAVEYYEKQGYKVVVELPRSGIPIYMGEDTKEFINSKNGKRLLRGLDKEKAKE